MIRMALCMSFLLAGCATHRALHESDFARLDPGMSQADVRRIVGEPARTESFQRLHEVAWDYPFTDGWGYFAFCSVIFDSQGRVLRKQHIRIEPNDH